MKVVTVFQFYKLKHETQSTAHCFYCAYWSYKLTCHWDYFWTRTNPDLLPSCSSETPIPFICLMTSDLTNAAAGFGLNERSFLIPPPYIAFRLLWCFLKAGSIQICQYPAPEVIFKFHISSAEKCTLHSIHSITTLIINAKYCYLIKLALYMTFLNIKA